MKIFFNYEDNLIENIFKMKQTSCHSYMYMHIAYSSNPRLQIIAFLENKVNIAVFPDPLFFTRDRAGILAYS